MTKPLTLDGLLALAEKATRTQQQEGITPWQYDDVFSPAVVTALCRVVQASDALRAEHTSFAAIDMAEKAYDAARAALDAALRGKP